MEQKLDKTHFVLNPMIELDEFKIKGKEYVWLIFWLGVPYKLVGLAYVTLFLCACAIVSDRWVFTIGFSVTLVVCVLVSLYCTGREYAYSKENNAVTQKRKMSFGNGIFHILEEDGLEAQVPLSRIYEANIFRGYYWLFTNSTTDYLIPISAFRSEEDRMRFEMEILGDKLKPSAIPWKHLFIILLMFSLLLVFACVWRILGHA